MRYKQYHPSMMKPRRHRTVSGGVPQGRSRLWPQVGSRCKLAIAFLAPTPMPSPHLTPPKQARSRRTLERIVAASLELLATEGPDGLTVHAVVDKADSSVGSFYARFKGKDDLLDYLGERLWGEALERWHALLRSQDWSTYELAGLIRASVGLLVDAQRSRSAYLRALDRAAGSGQNAYGHFRDQVVDGVVELLLHRRAEIAHDDPARAVWIGVRGVVGVIDADGRESSRLDRETLVEECATLLYGYLSGSPGAVAEADEPSFFDVWG